MLEEKDWFSDAQRVEFVALGLGSVRSHYSGLGGSS